MQYTRYEVETAPPWLQRKWGTRWNYVSGLVKDAWGECARLAVKARFPKLAPDDGLDRLLRDYVLDERYNERAAATRSRLSRAWETWQLAGTKRGLIVALDAAGYPNVTIQERLARWWQFRVIIRPPLPWDPYVVPLARWRPKWRWGDGTRFVALVPPRERARVTALVRKWKPAHAHCVAIVVVLEGRLWGDGWRWGDGTRFGGLAVRWSA